ncbi:helix-turn-helix transcriptional regulator [Sphingomonas sp. G-3-2-10]|uniref:helix-turn-helix transcriptional regulator n=1 Tax=Sphingomonas sp. G-3-2-10 TaxID=2728838 RepID=UPI00146B6C9D|nr:helix-turn-helix transcriptional regulator [Sphingomonas sp. G-3-2-10]NML08227.1 helix-turn-helix transcriptional regulator [Sphingomonas sp. G-3-2-10]
MSAAGPDIEFYQPTGALMPFVESFYLFRYDAASIDGVERVDMGQIRFMLKGEGVLTFPDGHSEPSLPVMVNGAGTGAASYHVDGPFHCFGVSLRAIGWKALIGLPAHEVADSILNGADVFGPEALAILETLRGLTRLDEMIAAVEPFLLARRRKVPPAHLALARAVREWAASGEPGIDALYRLVPMGPRQATRLCNEYFGGPPKHLERKFRAIRAAMQIYQGVDPREAAEPFADQPHMIKEIKHFTGHTPTTLKAGIDPVLAVTLDNETFHFLPDVIPESVDG